jgi:hypothetical protein
MPSCDQEATQEDAAHGEQGFVVLFRFGARDHLAAFRREGLLYMNSLRHFAKLEGDAARSDRFEGADEIHQPRDIVSLQIGGDDGRPALELKPHLAGPFSFARSAPSWNVFCMHGMRVVTDPLVDERNFRFGDSFVIVLDTAAFIERFRDEAKARGLQPEWRPVEYFNAAEHSGDVGPFRKSHAFDYQREFRLALWPGEPGPITLRLGDLTDLTSPVLPLAEINKIVRITPGSRS